MLHLHHADHLDPLIDALASVLAAPVTDPFTPDVIAVPTAGARDWVTAGLGRRLGTTGAGDGVAANLEFLFPGALVARALGVRRRPGEPDDDPWSLERMTWTVLEVLAQGKVAVPRGSGSGGPERPVDRWALARRIADLFDRYATQRPRLVEAWAEGRDTDGTSMPDGAPAPLDDAHRWQAELWRLVRERIGTPSPPERLPGLLQALRRGELEPALPERVVLFGVASLAPAPLTALQALGTVRDVHVFVRHPSHVAWASAPNRLAGGLVPRNPVDVSVHTRHPLLSSWGRPALETRALVAGLPHVVELGHGTPPGGLAAVGQDGRERTLLMALQQGIREDRAVVADPRIVPGDGSVQVHACHGAQRQLEVLRDALGHAFVADPTLAAHEVLVLCPDLERFAPLVQAVLGRGALPVPVRLGDRTLTTEEPVVGALQAVLALVAGRCTLSDLLALFEREPVRARCGWSIADIERITSWCGELGTRWGLDPAQRTAWGLPGDLSTGTWRASVDRLLAGIALPAPTPRAVLGDVAPFDDMGTDEVVPVGRLADLLARLVDLHSVVTTPRPVADWVEVLHSVVDAFCATAADERWRLHDVHGTLDHLITSATTEAGPCAVPLDITDVQALLISQFGDTPGRLPLRSGAVTVTSLVPQRGVPARVVCILGLDDGSMRAVPFDGDDVLGTRPCVGESHPRYEQRHLLLDAVLAARERLIVTCDGADLTTNREVPFAVPLVELLDVIGDIASLDPTRAPVVVRHRRHGFHEAALQPGGLIAGSLTPFTFDPAMLAAAQAHRSVVARSAEPDRGVVSWALPAVPVTAFTVADLVSAVKNPARVLLRDRLDVRLPGEMDVVDDGLPLSVEPLEASALGRSLLDTRRAERPQEEWMTAARLDGTLPPGELATAALADVSEGVLELEATAATWTVPLSGIERLSIDQAVSVDPSVAAHGRLALGGEVTGIDAARLVRVFYTRPQATQPLAAAVELAAAQRQEPLVEWSAVIITRHQTGTRADGVGLRLRGTGEMRLAHAEALLTLAAELRAWASRDAVPLFRETSPLLATGDWAAAEAALAKDLLDAHTAKLWDGTSLESLSRDPVRLTDPAPVRAFSGESRAVATALWVWGTFRRAVEMFDARGEFVAQTGATADDDADADGEGGGT